MLQFVGRATVRRSIGFRRAPAREHRLKTDATDVRKFQTELDGLPKERQIVRRHRHRKRDRQMNFAAAFDCPDARRPQVRAAQSLLAFELNAVELEIELEVAALNDRGEARQKRVVAGDAHSVRVQQDVINARIVLDPFDQFEELRMQRRLAARELENLDSSLAVYDPLDATL